MFQNHKEQEITNLTKSKVLLKLKDLGVKSIRINFSGSGDSGDIDDVEYTDMNGTSSWSNNYIGPDTTNELDAEISDLFYDFVDEQACRHGDWVNNEGGYGTMIIYVDGTYQLDYHQRTTEFYQHSGESIYKESWLHA